MSINYSDTFPYSSGQQFVDELNSRFVALKIGVNLSVQNRGDWFDSFQYNANDLVSYNSAKWISKTSNLNKPPTEGTDWTAFSSATPSGAANLIYATPVGTTGNATLRKIVLADLPFATSGTSDATKIVVANDSRLSNSRTPTSHAATHAAGGSDALTLTPAQVGLGNVTNTSDLSKPISTATQSALDLKANDTDVVHRTLAENIAGTKTFSSALVVPAPSSSNHAVNRGYVETYVAQQIANRAGEPAAGVQNTTELAAIPAASRSDKQTRLVEDEGGSYYYDLQSTATGQTNRVIVPTDGIGRWFKGTSDTQDHNNLLGLQGGTSTERYHVTSVEKGRIPNSNVTDALTGTGAPSASNKFVTFDGLVDSNINTTDNTSATPATKVALSTALLNLFNKFSSYALRTLDGLSTAERTTARANLDLGNSSTLNVGTTAGTVAAADDSRIVNASQLGATNTFSKKQTVGGLTITKADTVGAGLFNFDVLTDPKNTGRNALYLTSNPTGNRFYLSGITMNLEGASIESMPNFTFLAGNGIFWVGSGNKLTGDGNNATFTIGGNTPLNVSAAGISATGIYTFGNVAVGADVALSAAATLSATDGYHAIYLNTASASINQALPSAVGLNGREYKFFKNSGANTMTLSPPTNQGTATSLLAFESCVVYRAFGNKWWRISVFGM